MFWVVVVPLPPLGVEVVVPRRCALPAGAMEFVPVPVTPPVAPGAAPAARPALTPAPEPDVEPDVEPVAVVDVLAMPVVGRALRLELVVPDPLTVELVVPDPPTVELVVPVAVPDELVVLPDTPVATPALALEEEEPDTCRGAQGCTMGKAVSQVSLNHAELAALAVKTAMCKSR
jgi:hypothetical protein